MRPFTHRAGERVRRALMRSQRVFVILIAIFQTVARPRERTEAHSPRVEPLHARVHSPVPVLELGLSFGN